MSTAETATPEARPLWLLIVVRICASYIALCQLGALAGSLVPLFVPTSRTAVYTPLLPSLALIHSLVALVTAGMLFVVLRSARVGLLAALVINTVECTTLAYSISVPAAIMGFVFGLFLYIPPLVLIYWRPRDFR